MKVTCENCNHEFTVTRPVGVGKGSLAGIKLEDMTIEQLRQEKRNAKSVLYKSEKAGRDENSLAPKRERVAAVEARLVEVLAAQAPAKTEEVAVEATEEVAVEATEEVTE